MCYLPNGCGSRTRDRNWEPSCSRSWPQEITLTLSEQVKYFIKKGQLISAINVAKTMSKPEIREFEEEIIFAALHLEDKEKQKMVLKNLKQLL